MVASTQPSPLLALPLELRISVYKQLLSPDPDRVHTLYRDRLGRVSPFDIDPTILRVSKQVYSEAVSILYDNASIRIYLGTRVVRQCTGRNYPDRLDEPPDLFRTDNEEAFRSAERLKWRIVSSSVESVQFEEQLEPVPRGYIYPHCFQRLRKIQLITSRDAIWGHRWGGSYFSHTGQTVLRILRLLAKEQISESKRLKISIEPHWRTVEAQLLMRNGETDTRTNAIVGLLKALERNTGAEIKLEEGTLTKTMNELKMEDAEIDKWEKVLLADADAGIFSN